MSIFAESKAFLSRSKSDYISQNCPTLILIAKEPLERDRMEILDSPQGRTYLSECFKSKYKASTTHITYIKDAISNFSSTVLPEILAVYTERLGLNCEQVVLGFIGQEALDTFEAEIDGVYNPSQMCDYILDKTNKVIRYSDQRVTGRSRKSIPYAVLPGLDEASALTATLNDIEITGLQIESPYCSTGEIINKFNQIIELYENSFIKGFCFDFKFNEVSNRVDYFTVFDSLTNETLSYCKNDILCENDSAQLREEYVNAFKNLLKKVPVYSNDLDMTKKALSLCRFDFEISYIDKETGNTCLDKSFVITGDANGTTSEWYDNWNKKVFPTLGLKKTSEEAKRLGYSDDVKYEWIYDIEVFQHDWLFVAKSMDGNSKVICWNDPYSLRDWIKNKILIGFNNAAYDDDVIKYAMSLPYIDTKNLKGPVKSVKEYSDMLINDEGKNYRPKTIGYKNPPFLSWDVSFHMPFDIRRNSLKKLTMSVLNRKNYDSSVPFTIETKLTPSQRLDVEKYCEMDVDNTRDLFLPDPADVEAQKENPKHKFREFARDSYDIRWNLIIEYNMTPKTLINKSSSFAGKVLCGEDAKPNSEYTFKIVDGKKQYYSIPERAFTELAGSPVLQFYIDNQSNRDYIHEKFEYYLGGDDDGHKYQFGFGGLHQALLGYSSTNLVNMDVASLYPSLLVQYNLMSRGAKNPESYKEVYETRLAAKREGKTLLNLGLKLILNGSIGAMLSEYNPLYDTWSNSSICVHGQLLLFILVKRLYDAGFNIVQTNTDGIMIERQADVDFMPICKQWEEDSKLVLEYDEIDILQQNNVNNYYCKFTNGKVKSKGFYLSNEKFGKATSKILCNIVTNKPALEGTEPRDYVIYKKHSIGEIYDGITREKLEGRSLAFVVGYADDPRTQSYYSRSRNEREVVVKDEKGKPVLDESGQAVTTIVNTESKITGFTDNMLLVDDVNTLTMEEINTREYINFAKNLLNQVEAFGPYYDVGFVKSEEPTYLQALNPLKDNTDPHPTKSGVICQNFLFECDYATKEEQEELIEACKDKLYRVVWSGNKSYHCVVRLDAPVTSTNYKKVWYYLKYKLGFVGADEQCSIPSKYTRVPDQINPKTGNMQVLYSEDKNVLSKAEILEAMPKLKDEIKPITSYKGQVTIKALERHIKRQDWSEGNRFSAVQKLSPILISQVEYETLLGMIPVKLDKDHKRVIRAKYFYWEKYKDESRE